MIENLRTLQYSNTLDHCASPCLIKVFYRKVPKFSEARKLCWNLPKIQTKRPTLRVFHQKDANGIANSGDPDQSVLVMHCLSRPICPKTKDHYGTLKSLLLAVSALSGISSSRVLIYL